MHDYTIGSVLIKLRTAVLMYPWRLIMIQTYEFASGSHLQFNVHVCVKVKPAR